MATTTPATAINSTLGATETGRSPLWPRSKKKSVVFADSQGLALTAVHFFSEFEEDLLGELQIHLSEIGSAAHLRDNKGD